VIGVRNASHGMAEIQSARSRLSASDIVAEGPTKYLRVAGRDFDAAHAALDSPLLAPVEILPVIGRQLRSVQALSNAAAQVSHIGVVVLTRAHGILSTPHASGPARIAVLRSLSALAASTDRRLGTIDTGPSVALLGPLATKHDTFVHDLASLRTRLQNAANTTAAVAGILQGPQTYLLLMSNNAEMRAGSGAFLTIGVLQSKEGVLHLSDVEQASSLALPAAGVPVGTDLEELWGWAGPGADARNLGLTPQFDVTGPLAASMWSASTGQSVNGVLAVDVLALQQVLQVTGPFTLADGTKVGPQNVVELLTHDQYVGLSDEGASGATQARTDELGAIAHGALGALQGESLDMRSLAGAMAAMAAGRHLMAWSSRPSTESAWLGAGVAGDITGKTAMAAVVNRGGNKLDQYLTVNVSLRFDRGKHFTDATLSVDLRNQVPPGQSQYIAGPFPGLGTVYGEYTGLLALNLPAVASDLRLGSGPRLVAIGAEGPAWLLSATADVLAGQQERLVVTFHLPEHGSMTVEPTARLSPEVWDVAGRRFTDAGPVSVNW